MRDRPWPLRPSASAPISARADCARSISIRTGLCKRHARHAARHPPAKARAASLAPFVQHAAHVAGGHRADAGTSAFFRHPAICGVMEVIFGASASGEPARSGSAAKTSAAPLMRPAFSASASAASSTTPPRAASMRIAVGFDLREPLGTDEIARLRIERHVQADGVGARKQRIEIDALDIVLGPRPAPWLRGPRRRCYMRDNCAYRARGHGSPSRRASSRSREPQRLGSNFAADSQALARPCSREHIGARSERAANEDQHRRGDHLFRDRHIVGAGRRRTAMPRAVQASTSTLSSPTPSRPIASSRAPA